MAPSTKRKIILSSAQIVNKTCSAAFRNQLSWLMGGAYPERVRCGARDNEPFSGRVHSGSDRPIYLIHTTINRMSYNPVTVFDAISAYLLEVRNISE